MANKSFEERAAAAVSDPRFRLADLRTLLREGQELAKQLEGTLAQAERSAIDYQLDAVDRDAAEKLSAETSRRIKVLAGALDALTAKYAERQASEKLQAAEAERKAAIAERDELAARFKAMVQPVTEALPGLLAAVRANRKRLKQAGVKGALDAELLARGLTSEYVGHAPIFRFIEMRIPAWADAGQAWPDGMLEAPGSTVYDPAKAARQRRENVEKARAQWGRYRLTAPTGPPIRFAERLPGKRTRDRSIYHEHDPAVCDLDHAEADRLRKLGVVAEQLEDQVSDAALIYY